MRSSELEWKLSCLCPNGRRKRYALNRVRRVNSAETGRSERCWDPGPFGNRCATSDCVPCWNRFFDGIHPSSYGLRPGRSAIRRISKSRNCSFAATSVHWVCIWTCQNASTRWDHDLILRSSGVGDRWQRVGAWLETQLAEQRRDAWTPVTRPRSVAAPQGGSFSPLIAKTSIWMPSISHEKPGSPDRPLYGMIFLIRVVAPRAAFGTNART